MKFKRECLICHKKIPYERRFCNRVYCSKKCKDLSLRKPIGSWGTCENCGENLSSRHQTKYCSNECQHATEESAP